MGNQIMTYYIPNNPNIKEGTIYTLYINNNTNLELSSILNTQVITLNNNKESNQITISKEDYTRLLELNNIAYQLNMKRTSDIKNFIEAETKTTEELTKINTKRQELIKKLTKGKDFNQ